MSINMVSPVSFKANDYVLVPMKVPERKSPVKEGVTSGVKSFASMYVINYILNKGIAFAQTKNFKTAKVSHLFIGAFAAAVGLLSGVSRGVGISKQNKEIAQMKAQNNQ